MNTEVTSQQVKQYRSQGYLVIDNFLTPSELEHWRTVTADAVNARLADNDTANTGEDVLRGIEGGYQPAFRRFRGGDRL